MSGRSHRLVRRGDLFYFRAAVPKAWRSAIKASEIKFTLKTRDRGTALVRCRVLSNAFDLFFGTAMAGAPPSLEQLDLAVRSYFQRRLDKALQLSIDLPHDAQVDVDLEIDGLRREVAQLKAALKQKSFDQIVRSDAEDIVRGHVGHAVPLPLGSIKYAEIGVARAQIEQRNYLIKALEGDYSEVVPSDDLFKGMTPRSIEEPDHVPDEMTLLQARERFLAKKSSLWVEKTTMDNQRVLDIALAAIGPQKHVKHIATVDVKAVRDLLAQLPKNATKQKANAGKNLLTLIEDGSNGERVSIRTQAKYFAMFRGFLHWLVAEEEIEKMPGPTIRVDGVGTSPAQDERRPYSLPQLQRIFSSPLFTGCQSRARRATAGSEVYRDGYFWIPLVALFSGMRLGEIVQLATDDIKQEGNLTYFDVTLSGGKGKKLKTKSSVRRVPVHQSLIALGFIDYLLKAKAAGKQRVFHDISPGNDGYYSHNFSKWWGRYCRKVGVWETKTAFHSFRHNFTDALREAEVPEAIARSLVGHADGSVHSKYGSGVSLQKLRLHLDRVEYPGVHIPV